MPTDFARSRTVRTRIRRSLPLVFLFAGSFALALACSCDAADTVAHRGASHDAPENTITAFKLAWKQYADAIEGDFFLTSDGHIVCIHDKTTKRLAERDISVADSTLAELRKLDVGSWKNSRFRGERIPTLLDVLETVPPGKRIFIEIKCGSEILPQLEEDLAKCQLTEQQIVLISFNKEVIAAAAKRFPNLKRLWVTSIKQDEATQEWSPSLQEMLATAKKIEATGIDVKAVKEVVTADFVKTVHDSGLELHVWTVNDPQFAMQLGQMKVDSVTTDKPGLIIRALALSNANTGSGR